jgi:hypothetical protein
MKLGYYILCWNLKQTKYIIDGNGKMQNGNAVIDTIWYGTNLNRQPIEKIPFLGEFKIYYNILCKEVGNVVIGIFVDDRLIQLYEHKISSKHLEEEMCFWFKYPLRFKTEGIHKISFGLGHQKEMSDKTSKLDIEWVYESNDFSVKIEK